MILDSPCDVDGCNSPVEFVKGQTYQSTGGAVTMVYLRCLNQHYYLKYKEELLDLEMSFKQESEEAYEQTELPFED